MFIPVVVSQFGGWVCFSSTRASVTINSLKSHPGGVVVTIISDLHNCCSHYHAHVLLKSSICSSLHETVDSAGPLFSRLCSSNPFCGSLEASNWLCYCCYHYWCNTKKSDENWNLFQDFSHVSIVFLDRTTLFVLPSSILQHCTRKFLHGSLMNSLRSVHCLPRNSARCIVAHPILFEITESIARFRIPQFSTLL